MKLRVNINKEIKLSPTISLKNMENSTVLINSVCVFDDDFKILPIISEYLSYTLQNKKLAHKTVPTYARNLMYFLNYIRTRSDYKKNESDKVFITITKHEIQGYLTYLSDIEHKKSTTIRNRDATICAFMKYLCDPNENSEPLRIDNPYSDGYLSPSPKRSAITYCTVDEIEALIQATPWERERVLLQFLLDSGIRRSELPRITLEDFNKATNFNSEVSIKYDTDILVSSPYKPLEIKGSKARADELKSRYALISLATLDRIKKYHSSPLYKKHIRNYTDPTLIPAFLNAQGNPYTPNSIDKLLKRVSNRARKKGKLCRMISPHKLRHGCAYLILQSSDLGKDYLDRLIILQKTLGHNHLNTTQIYTSIPPEIYNSLCDEHGDPLTKAEKMKRLSKQTQLKIGMRDAK